MQPRPDEEVVPRSTLRRRTWIVVVVSVVVIAVIVVWWMTSSHGQFGGGRSGGDPSGLRIVEVAQIDRNGAAVNQPAREVAADPAGDGKAVCLPLSIAIVGGLTGPASDRDAGIENGAQIAVDEHNAANAGCQVQLKPFDTGGDPNAAAGTVAKIVEDPYTIGVIGPSSSDEAATMGPLFDRAGVAAATPSATEVVLSDHGWRTFFRGLANDGVQGLSVANYLKNTLGYRTVCIVHDRTDYGRALAQAVQVVLGPIARQSCSTSVGVGDKDFSAAVDQVGSASPGAVFYAGHYTEAAELVKQLRTGGVTATFATAGASKDAAFVQQAGGSSMGAFLSCACAPATGTFAEEYVHKLGREPGAYSAEAYDLATIMLKGIDAGTITRPALLDFMHGYDGQGVAGHYRWNESGELTAPMIWMYRVQ